MRALEARFVAAALVCALSTSPAQAQMLCGDRAQIVDVLEQDYKEHRVATGLSDAGALLEVFVSESQSWTVVFTIPGGHSCVLSGGQNWEEITPAAPSEES